LVDIILIETEMDETIFGGGYGVSDFVLSDATSVLVAVRTAIP
jgi:hypothetical protein